MLHQIKTEWPGRGLRQCEADEWQEQALGDHGSIRALCGKKMLFPTGVRTKMGLLSSPQGGRLSVMMCDDELRVCHKLLSM